MSRPTNSYKTDIDNRMRRMQRNCQDCDFYESHMCAYIDIMGVSRSSICGGGDACTVKVLRDGKKKKTGITINAKEFEDEENAKNQGAVHGFRPGSSGI